MIMPASDAAASLAKRVGRLKPGLSLLHAILLHHPSPLRIVAARQRDEEVVVQGCRACVVLTPHRCPMRVDSEASRSNSSLFANRKSAPESAPNRTEHVGLSSPLSQTPFAAALN